MRGRGRECVCVGKMHYNKYFYVLLLCVCACATKEGGGGTTMGRSYNYVVLVGGLYSSPASSSKTFTNCFLDK